MSDWLIGIDEAGRGPVIGPLVVSALAIPATDRSSLVDLGVRDSKDLTANARESIQESIRQLTRQRDWGIGTIVCEPARIDVNRLDSNLNSLEIALFAEAIRSAIDPDDGGTILADACDVDEARFARRLRAALGGEWAHWEIDARHGMDATDPVAGAASIIAKVTRDAAIAEHSARLGIDLGSGYPSDQRTRAALPDLLSGDTPHDCLRWSWSTVSDLWQEMHSRPVPVRSRSGGAVVQSSLDDW